MRSTRSKRKYNKNFSIKCIVFILILAMVAISNNFNPIISQTSAELTDSYNTLTVDWARTKEHKDYSYSSKFIDGDKNNRSLWENKKINGVDYKYLYSNNNQNGILRTERIIGNPYSERYLFDYDNMVKLLSPTDKSNVWDGLSGNRYFNDYCYGLSSSYPDFATWSHLSSSNINNSKDQWRMFRGTFELTESQIQNIKNGKSSVFVGTENKGAQLIMPVNDFMMVVVDKQITNMNFSTQDARRQDKFNLFIDGKVETPVFSDDNNLYYREKDNYGNFNNKCSNQEHLKASKHTDTWHAHLNKTVNDGSTTRLGDISKQLINDKNITNGKHTIDLIVGDYNGGGGISKIELYYVATPEIKVEKKAYILDDNNERIFINEDTSLREGEKVYYTFELTNDCDVDLTGSNIEFTDESLGLVINSKGTLLNGNKCDEKKLVITNFVNGNAVNHTGREALDLLKNGLKPHEKIIVSEQKDGLFHVINENDVQNKKYTNTVVAKVDYLDGQLFVEDSSSFTTKVEENSLENVYISKEVNKITRKDSIIYTKEDNQELPLLRTSDKVEFLITIKNDNPSDITSLFLSDKLTGSSYSVEEWQFKKGEQDFNNNFTIKKNSTIKLTTEWKVKGPSEDGDSLVKNVAKLTKGNKFIESNEVSLEIGGYIKIKKSIDETEFNEKDSNKLYSIKITDSNGKVYNAEIKKDKELVLYDLKYGVEYTVSEIEPMNYDKSSMYFSSDPNNRMVDFKFTMNSQNNKKKLVIENKIINQKYFFDSDSKTNTFIFSAQCE